MKVRCVQALLVLATVCTSPLLAAADAPVSPALIRATKPVVARDLERRQQQHAKHHASGRQCRDHDAHAREH